jgi:RNA polymerase sigma-70 factor (ECF subfamily)
MLLGVLSGPSDEDLVRRVQQGDSSAFGELVLRYQDRIYTVCLRQLGERTLAEEVAQDVFLSAFRALGNFRGDAKLSTWLFRIAINQCKNKRLYNRRRAHGRHEPLDGEPHPDRPARQLAHPERGPDAGVHRSEAERLLAEALQELEPDYRSIIVLRDIEDLAYDDIAEALGIARGTVKSRLHRARAQLARLLSRNLKKDDVL